MFNKNKNPPKSPLFLMLFSYVIMATAVLAYKWGIEAAASVALAGVLVNRFGHTLMIWKPKK